MGTVSRFSVLAVFAIVSLLFSVVTVQGQVTTLPYTDQLPPCSNGVQDGNETGVDCGGSCALTVGCVGNCTSAFIVDYCDGKDNDKDCLVDEDCKPKLQPVAAPKPAKPAPCYNGELDTGEEGIDCGGTCFKDWVIEACDGIDNDRDCLVDEGDACLSAPKTTPQPAPIITPATPSTIPEVVPTPEPVSAPVPAPEPQSEPGTPVEVPAAPAQEVQAVSDVDVDSLTDDELDAFIEQNGGADFIKQMRKLAEEKGIYVPKSEPDAQFGRRYVRYFFKHQPELAAKFEGKEPTEDELVGILKQFSEEAYPKPVQQQSFFSKVAGFFKRLFS